MSGPLLSVVLPLRTVVPVEDLAGAAAHIRNLSGGQPVVLSGPQVAAVPELGVVAAVAVRMMDARGPTEICTVAYGRPGAAQALRADLGQALAAALDPRRAA